MFSEVLLFLVSFQTLQPQAEKMKQDSVEEQRVNRIILLKYTPSNSVKRKVNKRTFLTVKIFLCTQNGNGKIIQHNFGTLIHTMCDRKEKSLLNGNSFSSMISSFRGMSKSSGILLLANNIFPHTYVRTER